MTKARKIHIGEVFKTKSSGDATVLLYTDASHILVEFSDGSTKVVRAGHLRSGAIRNNYDRCVCGIGFVGEGSHATFHNGKHTRAYNAWYNMLDRCYNSKRQQIQPTYKGISVCAEWHNFQNFAEWFDGQKCTDSTWQLDKDLTVIGNCIYSPDTCALIPQEVNLVLGKNSANRGNCLIGVCRTSGDKFSAQCSTGYGHSRTLGVFDSEQEAFNCYKSHKEIAVRNLANKWKDVLPNKVYENLMNFSVTTSD